MSTSRDTPPVDSAETWLADDRTAVEGDARAPEPDIDVPIDDPTIALEVDFEKLPPLPPLPAELPPVRGGATSPPAPADSAESERWQAMIATYEAEARGLDGTHAAARLYLEIGRIWEEHLGRPRNAATCYQRAFQIDKRDASVLHAARRLFTESDNPGMVAHLLRDEAEVSEDPERRATLLAERGAVLEDRLGKAEDAQQTFRDALGIWAAEPLAILSLEQLHLARREHTALHGVYLRALAVAQAPAHRVGLLTAAAQLAEDHLDDPDAAVRSYQAILEIDSTSPLALAALRRLLDRLGRWEELVKVLVRSAEVAESAEQATGFLVSAARIELEHLNATDRALTSMLRALEHTPTDLVLLREFERLYEANDRFEDVAKVLTREAEIASSAEERVSVLFRLGSVLEERLGRPDEAMSHYEEAVQLAPEYLPARQALGRLYERTGRWSALAALFEREIELAAPATSVNLRLKLAELYESRLDRAAAASLELWKVLEQVPGHGPAVRALERLLTAAARWRDLVDLYEREQADLEEAEPKIFVLLRIARLWEERLEAPAEALACFERILALAPRHLEAIHGLARAAARVDAWSTAVRACDLEIDASADQSEVLALMCKKAVLFEERTGELERSVGTYREVLSLAPSYLPALRNLGRIFRTHERWTELIEMYERELEAANADEQAIGLLFRVAEVAVDRLGDDSAAIAAYERILARDPKSAPALHALGQIYARRRDHAALEGVLSRQAEAVADPARKAQILRAVAELAETELMRPDRAAEALQEILRLGVSRATTLESLVRIFSAAGLWSALGLALRSAADAAAEPRSRAAILARCAEVYGEKLGKPDQSAALLEEALALFPEDRALLGQLERVHVEAGAWVEVVKVSERIAALETDPRVYAARQVRLAMLVEQKLDPPRSGARHYRAALERLPSHPVALRGLEAAHRRAQDWSGLCALYQREAMTSTHPDRRGHLSFRAGAIAEHRLGDDARAEAAYRAALEVVPVHLPALAGLRRVAGRRGDKMTVLETIRLEAERSADRARASELAFEAGVAYQDDFGDRDAAEAAFRRVLEHDPGHPGASQRMEKVLRDGERWAELLALLASRGDAEEDARRRAELYLAAAHLAQDKLADRPKAISLFEQVLALEPENLTAMTRLGPLLVGASRPDDAIDVFAAVAATAKDPPVVASAFRSLGVLYEEHRRDLVKAVHSYQSAFSADPKDAQSLRRLAAVYSAASDWTSAVNVMLRLVDVERGDPHRVVTLVELARVYEKHLGDDENAAKAYTKAVDLDPSALEASLGLIALFERRKQWAALAKVSEAYLAALPAARKADALPLHVRLAEVYELKLSDEERAMRELRQALAIEPAHAAALERLAGLYGKHENTYAQAVDLHRRLLRVDPFRVESYHQIRRIFERRREHDKAFVVCELLAFLRAQLPEEDLLYNEFRDKVAPHAGGELTAEEHEKWIVHPGERGLARGILEVLVPEVGKVFPSDLTRYELNPKTDRFPPKGEGSLRRLLDEIAQVLGAPPFDLWVSRRLEAEIVVEMAEPPALIVGHQLDRRLREADKRFLLARQVERLMSGHRLLEQLGPEAARRTLMGALRSVNASYPVLPAEEAEVDASARRLKGLSKKARKQLEGFAGAKLELDAAAHATAGKLSVNRAGLALTNDLDVTLRAIAREDGLRPVFADAAGAREAIGASAGVRDLLAYAVSDEYFAVRAKLGFSIQS